MKGRCSSSELEIKTDQFYFLHNHRYNINICLLIEFWRFLNFLSEPRLARRLATPKRAMRKLRVNSSPASSWGWYITYMPYFSNWKDRPQSSAVSFRVSKTTLSDWYWWCLVLQFMPRGFFCTFISTASSRFWRCCSPIVGRLYLLTTDTFKLT